MPYIPYNFGQRIIGTKLTFIKFLGTGNGKRTRYLMRCECGTYTAVYPYNISSGVTKSCGCIKFIRKPQSEYTLRPEYIILQSIRQRCTNPKNKDYVYLSKIPEPVDPRWIYNTKAFFEDMGFRPKGMTHLLRRDKGLGYNKDNCYWGTAADLVTNKNPLNPYGKKPVHSFMGEPTFIREFAQVALMSINSVNRHLRQGKTMDQIFAEKCARG